MKVNKSGQAVLTGLLLVLPLSPAAPLDLHQHHPGSSNPQVLSTSPGLHPGQGQQPQLSSSGKLCRLHRVQRASYWKK